MRALCRLDCDDSIPVTTEVVTSDGGFTTAELTTEVPISQRMFYIRNTESYSSYGDIYDYVIDDVDGPQLKGKFRIPYATYLPGMTFNYDLKMFLIL